VPRVTLAHQPSLTKQALAEILAKGFLGRCEVYPTKLLGTDIVVKQSAWTGASVTLKQSGRATSVAVGSLAPSAASRVAIVLFMPWLLLYFTTWRRLRDEVCDFLRNAPELNGHAPLAGASETAIVTARQSSTGAPAGTRGGLRLPVMAGGMVGASVLVSCVLGLVFGGGINWDYFLSAFWLTDAVLIAAAAAVAVKAFDGAIVNPLARGGAVGVAAFVLGYTAADLLLAATGFGYFGGWIVTQWFGLYGLSEAALGAAAGAALAARTSESSS
jgi:hypothetical protein